MTFRFYISPFDGHSLCKHKIAFFVSFLLDFLLLRSQVHETCKARFGIHNKSPEQTSRFIFHHWCQRIKKRFSDKKERKKNNSKGCYKKEYANGFNLSTGSSYALNRRKMGFIRFVVAAVVVIVIVTTDVEATARQQQQFYDDQIYPQQQNSFSNYFRPNHMMNQFNRRRPLNHRNTPISAFASYPDADQAKNIFGFGFGFGGGLTTNFLTT